jgi:hypothetical protein
MYERQRYFIGTKVRALKSKPLLLLVLLWQELTERGLILHFPLNKTALISLWFVKQNKRMQSSRKKDNFLGRMMKISNLVLSAISERMNFISSTNS